MIPTAPRRRLSVGDCTAGRCGVPRVSATLRKLVSDAQALRKSGEALADAVMPALSDKYNRWDAFKYLARPNILETDAELSGKKRIPQAQATIGRPAAP